MLTIVLRTIVILFRTLRKDEVIVFMATPLRSHTDVVIIRRKGVHGKVYDHL